ncbi:MAG: branched-chain amino acid ABC transporter permease [Acidobacteriota bacterium]
MDVFLQLTLSGLANGMVYALVAVGFVVIYKSSDVINFAQGEFLLFGAYLAYTLIVDLGLHWSLGVALTLVLGAGLGLLVERLILRPLIGEPVISMIMVTIGLSSLLKAVVNGIWGATPRAFPSFVPDRVFEVGGAVLRADRLLIIAVALVLLGLLSLFFRYTRDGIAMRAIADDQQAALSMGISIKRVLAVAWAIAAITAGVAGVMLANIVGVGQEISFVGLRVFPVVILGGLDSIPGAIVGGAFIGLLEAYTAGYVGHGLNLVVPFIVLILVLIVRPYGLFGKQIIERV